MKRGGEAWVVKMDSRLIDKALYAFYRGGGGETRGRRWSGVLSLQFRLGGRGNGEEVGALRVDHRSGRGGGKVGQPEGRRSGAKPGAWRRRLYGDLFRPKEGEGSFMDFDWAGLGRMDQMVVGPAGVIRAGWNMGQLGWQKGAVA
jgi:hypothetical protein